MKNKDNIDLFEAFEELQDEIEDLDDKLSSEERTERVL